jgi:DNA-binding IclR family transcriptional regulator
LKKIARVGYALDNEEFMEGMAAIAVPVIDRNGKFLAALACHGPAMRFNLEDAVAKKDILAAGAEKLTTIMFEDDN